MNNKLSTPTALILAAIIIAGGLFFGLKDSNPNTKVEKELTTREISRAIKIEVNKNENLETKVTADENLSGDFKKAEVFVIEYASLECPVCKFFHSGERKNAFEHFMNDERVVFVTRHFPLGSPFTGRDMTPTAPEQAVIAECVGMLAGDEEFEKIIDIIYTETTHDGRFDLPFLLTQAEELGIKKSNLKECYSGPEAAARVAKQFQQGVIMGVQGTPTVFIQTKDGVVVEFDRNKSLIEEVNSFLK